MNRVLFKSETVEWPTPKALYEKLDAEFAFDFDPCPIQNVEGDGLATLFVPWKGKRVYCNPPYGPEIRKWLEKAREADVAVYLLPARTDTRWFHDLCLPFASEIRFIKGRLKFGDSQNNAPFPSMLVIYRTRESNIIPQKIDRRNSHDTAPPPPPDLPGH